MDDMISRRAAIDAYGDWYVEEGTEEGFIGTVKQLLEGLPSATQQETISEDYAKAVRNWLVHYQVKCVELQGRYTPYEVLGWVVSDWRRENEIW